MKQEISEYYRKRGFIDVYVSINKEPRRIATLRRADGSSTCMSYAKYLYTSHYKCDVAEGNQVDHINGDRMNDRIENLQVISREYNNLKDRKRKELLCTCPICGQEFLYEKRNLKFHPDPCCSKECGRKKASRTLRKRGDEKRKHIDHKYKCIVCGKPFKAVTGKKYCSEECREKDKNYPTMKEIDTQYKLLGSWEKVAKHFRVSRKVIYRLRKNNSIKS